MSPEELNQELFDFVKSLKERTDDLQLVAKRIQVDMAGDRSMNPVIYTAICEYFGNDPEPPPRLVTNIAKQLTEHVQAALDEAKIIRTVNALHALPIPTPDDLAGVLIKTNCNPDNGAYGKVYERNTDGTWCMLQDPSGADWGERQVPSTDIPLPAIVLWGR